MLKPQPTTDAVYFICICFSPICLFVCFFLLLTCVKVSLLLSAIWLNTKSENTHILVKNSGSETGPLWQFCTLKEKKKKKRSNIQVRLQRRKNPAEALQGCVSQPSQLSGLYREHFPTASIVAQGGQTHFSHQPRIHTADITPFILYRTPAYSSLCTSSLKTLKKKKLKLITESQYKLT